MCNHSLEHNIIVSIFCCFQHFLPSGLSSARSNWCELLLSNWGRATDETWATDVKLWWCWLPPSKSDRNRVTAWRSFFCLFICDIFCFLLLSIFQVRFTSVGTPTSLMEWEGYSPERILSLIGNILLAVSSFHILHASIRVCNPRGDGFLTTSPVSFFRHMMHCDAQCLLGGGSPSSITAVRHYPSTKSEMYVYILNPLTQKYLRRKI